MNATFLVPETFAARFSSPAELGRRALEALTLAEHQAGRLTHDEMKEVLGFLTTTELDHFFIDHGLPPTPPVELTAERLAEIEEIVEMSRALRDRLSLGGLNIADLIREGRR